MVAGIVLVMIVLATSMRAPSPDDALPTGQPNDVTTVQPTSDATRSADVGTQSERVSQHDRETGSLASADSVPDDEQAATDDTVGTVSVVEENSGEEPASDEPASDESTSGATAVGADGAVSGKSDDEATVVAPDDADAKDGSNADRATSTEAETEDPEESLVTSEPGAEEDTRPFVMPLGAEYEPHEILLSVDPGASVEEVEALLARTPGVAAQSIDAEEVASGLLSVSLEPGTTVEDGVNAVYNMGSDIVMGSQPNYVYHLAEELTEADLRARLNEDVETAAELESMADAGEGVADIEASDPEASGETAPAEDASEEPIVTEEADEAAEPMIEDAEEETTVAAEADTAADERGQDADERAQDSDEGVADGKSEQLGTQDANEPRLSLQEQLNATVNDPRAGEQWALTSIRAYEAWAQTKCEGNVAVAVLDNGFQLDHPDLAGNVIAGSAYNAYAASGGQANTSDVSVIGVSRIHGTHVAGIAGAVTNNGIGIAGTTYNARIVPIKVFNQSGESTTASLAKAYDYVMQHAEEYGIKVVNLSVGGKTSGDTFEDDEVIVRVRKAYARGIVTVAAACNRSEKSIPPFYAYPSDSPDFVSVINIQGVASSEGNDASGAYTVSRSDTSNYNVAGQGGANTRKGKNISAPGTSILSTVPGSAYDNDSGTSMATPAVSSVVALEFAANPSLSADAAVDILYASAHDIGDEGWDQVYGHGEVDAAEAVRMAKAGGVSVELSGGGKVVLRPVLPSAGYEYDGTAKEPSVEVTHINAEGTQTQLVRDTDFRVAYVDNTNAGIARVIVSGTGAFEGAFERALTFTIARRALTKDMVGLSEASLTYDARPLEPEIVLTDTGRGSGVTLVRNTDYTCVDTCEHNEKVGTGIVHITVTGKGNYTGQVSMTREFAIARRPINDQKIVVEPANALVYNGTAQKPSLTILHQRSEAVDNEMFYTLAEGTDYKLTCKDNVSVGEATATITGVGNYSGARTITFQIVRATLENGDAAVGEESYVWGGEPITPAVSVSHAGKKLAEKADYTVSYADNDRMGTATAIVHGVGNYQGSVAAHFRIVKSTLADATIRVTGTYIYTGNAIKPQVTVTLAGTTLKAGVDYELAYVNNVNAGTGLVNVTGKGEYGGSASAEFSIAKASNPLIASAKAASQSVAYSAKSARTLATNSAVSKAQGSVRYANASTNATAKKFSVAAKTGKVSVPKGIAVGTYRVRVKVSAAGNENYEAGSKTVSYEVVVNKASLAKAKVASVAAQAYTGKAVKPTPTVKLGGVTLRLGTDYTLKYKNNKKVGKATIIVSGKGSYKGSYKTTFRIVAPTVSYRAYRRATGWENTWAKNGATSGTTGQSRRLEGVRIKLGSDFPVSGGIAYRTHAQDYGWMGWKNNGATSGKAGSGKRLEAIQIKLTGKMAKKYDVWYCVHVQDYGWLGWTKNGARAGTTGKSRRLEAIRIVLTPKGGAAPGSTKRPFVAK